MSEKVQAIITGIIIDSLKAGNLPPWRCPWRMSMPMNLVTKKAYRGINIFLLSMKQYASPYWLTAAQVASKKGNIRKGEHYTPILFSGYFRKDPATGKLVRGSKDDERSFFLCRFYKVWNVEQCDGLNVPVEENVTPFSPIETCERIVSGYAGAPPINHGGNRACYSPSLDLISMPSPESFSKREEYYSTLFHELTHSTGAERRLNRKGITDPIKFASHEYSFEELVAECGSAFLCGQAGIETVTIENSAAYIENWLKRLQSDPKWVIDASAAAMKAFDHIMGTKFTSVEEDAAEAA